MAHDLPMMIVPIGVPPSEIPVGENILQKLDEVTTICQPLPPPSEDLQKFHDKATKVSPHLFATAVTVDHFTPANSAMVVADLEEYARPKQQSSSSTQSPSSQPPQAGVQNLIQRPPTEEPTSSTIIIRGLQNVRVDGTSFENCFAAVGYIIQCTRKTKWRHHHHL